MKPEIERKPVLAQVGGELMRVLRAHSPRERMRRRLVILLVGGAALAGASAASALTHTGPLAGVLASSDVPVPKPRHAVTPMTDGRCAELKADAGRAEPTVRRVDPRLRTMLGVFRRPQQRQEAVSNCGTELNGGENLTLGRVVALPGDAIALPWPARDAVCVGVEGLGGCPGIQLLQRHGAVTGLAGLGLRRVSSLNRREPAGAGVNRPRTRRPRKPHRLILARPVGVRLVAVVVSLATDAQCFAAASLTG